MRITSPADFRRSARRRLPRVLFDYLDGGAADEVTLATNEADFARIRFRQRVLVDVSRRSLACRFLGRERPAPLVLGPVGFVGAFRRDGEILAARAAHRFGLPYCLSMFSICSLESLRRATDGELWMQVYMTRDRAIAARVIDQARALGVETLCVTVDTPAGAIRERDVRSGMRGATRLTPRIALSLLARPSWCLDMAPAGFPRFGNLDGMPELGSNAFVQSANLARQIDPALDWTGLAALREAWTGNLVVKGVLDPEDARRARTLGVQAVVVSNHGGRQLDHVPSTIASVSGVAGALGAGCDTLMDSGVRRGIDVVKALALGARGVLLGRAYAYALASHGQDGVEAMLAGMLAEIDSALAHLGVTDIGDMSPDHVSGLNMPSMM